MFSKWKRQTFSFSACCLFFLARHLSRAFGPARVRSRTGNGRGPASHPSWTKCWPMSRAGEDKLQAEKENVCFLHSRKHSKTEFCTWNIETVLSWESGGLRKELFATSSFSRASTEEWRLENSWETRTYVIFKKLEFTKPRYCSILSVHFSTLQFTLHCSKLSSAEQGIYRPQAKSW